MASKRSLALMLAAAVLTGGLAVGTSTSAEAAPALASGLAASIPAAELGTGSNLLHQVHRRNYYHTHRRRVYPRRRVVVPAPAPALVPWTAAWIASCTRRYRSFNPRTGYYVAYSGRRVFCR